MTPKKPVSATLVDHLLTALPLGDYFSPVQLAGQLRWPLERVLAAIEAGELPARRVRGEWLISKDALNEMFRRGDQSRLSTSTPDCGGDSEAHRG